FFSWPSQGKVSAYPADEASAAASEPPLSDFLLGFARSSGAERVHLLAHGMGNRALLGALQRIATLSESGSPPVRFGQIILGAPAVDGEAFHYLAGVCPRLSQRTTLYVSSGDRVLAATAWRRSYPRAGLMPPVTVVAGIDTVAVQNVDQSLLGHGYY